eukprot:jgi/Chlat1/1726/Chrsp13S00114
MWSIGGRTEVEGSRAKFDKFLHTLTHAPLDVNLGPWLHVAIPPVKLRLPFPPELTDYNYVFSKQDCVWRLCLDHNEKGVVPLPTAAFHEIVHVLFSDPTATGKPVYIIDKVTSDLDKSCYSFMSSTFSAQTGANKIRADPGCHVDGKLDKRKKGVYGPLLGTKCLVFVMI